MMEVKIFKLLLLLFYITEAQSYYPPWIRTFKTIQGVPWYDGYFCKDNNDLVLTFMATEVSTYYVWINEVLVAGTEITVKFDAEASIFINHKSYTENNSRFTKEPDTINNIYTFEFTNKTGKLCELFRVEGNTPYHQIHITSLKINGVEKCHNPDMVLYTRSFWKISHEHLVLTAAHCVSRSGRPYNPEILEVALGKNYLYGNDTGAQSVKVFQIILHDEYNHRNLNNNIALLKLMTEARYSNYVQPACLWFDEIYDVIGTHEITGSVVGWGFDGMGTLNKTLNIDTIPQTPDITCVLFQPVFYHELLNGKTFCAGYQNGTTPCNGDSGGAFMACASFEANFDCQKAAQVRKKWWNVVLEARTRFGLPSQRKVSELVGTFKKI
ncbi:unnamed protein product, partial [Brenthis ino]